jgi:ferredoxin
MNRHDIICVMKFMQLRVTPAMAALIIDALEPAAGVSQAAAGGKAASELAALLRYRCVRFYGPDWRPAAARDCILCRDTGVITVPDVGGESASVQACPSSAHSRAIERDDAAEERRNEAAWVKLREQEVRDGETGP